MTLGSPCVFVESAATGARVAGIVLQALGIFRAPDSRGLRAFCGLRFVVQDLVGKVVHVSFLAHRLLLSSK